MSPVMTLSRALPRFSFKRQPHVNARDFQETFLNHRVHQNCSVLVLFTAGPHRTSPCSRRLCTRPRPRAQLRTSELGAPRARAHECAVWWREKGESSYLGQEPRAGQTLKEHALLGQRKRSRTDPAGCALPHCLQSCSELALLLDRYFSTSASSTPTSASNDFN